MKKQYDILNDARLDFSEYEEIPLTEQERAQIMKRIRKNIKKRNYTSRIMYTAACAASLLLVSQTSFAQDLLDRIITIGNSSIIVEETEQPDPAIVLDALKGQIFDKDGNVLTELTGSEDGIYDAKGHEVMIVHEEGANGIEYSLKPIEAATAAKTNTIHFSSAEELGKNLSFDLRIPDYLPEGFSLETAYGYANENSELFLNYGVLIYTDGVHSFMIQERKDSEENRFAATITNAEEMEFHGTAAVYNENEFHCTLEGTITSIMGQNVLKGEELLKVAKSLR